MSLRTHEKAAPQGAVILGRNNVASAKEADDSVPRSIVARGGGKLSVPVKELVHDLRRLMEPYAAVNLKERRCLYFKIYATD